MSHPENSSKTVPESASAIPSVEVFAVYGVEPEVQAYAMAKYSRSALSMKESLKEITTQKAEKFLNTFYFQYGHRSIADLAHIALAIEKLSILAAIAVADEQRWDGQERSTRYQDFKKSGYFLPDFGGDEQARTLYRDTMDGLFSVYDALSQRIYHYLAEMIPRPEEMKPEAYERTLRARAFDVSRYLLPLGTNTSLGEIVNARTLESQVAHLLSHTHCELRRLGDLLKNAALSPAYDVHRDSLEQLVEEIRALSPKLAARAADQLLRDVRVAPTLVKYANPNPYQIETRRALQQAAVEIIGRTQIAPSKPVDLLDEDPLEIELASTLLSSTATIPTARFARPFRPPAKKSAARSSTSACAPAAPTTKCSAPSAPATSSASTSSWTSAASATCTATAAASRSARASLPATATTRPPKSTPPALARATMPPGKTPPSRPNRSRAAPAKRLSKTPSTSSPWATASAPCSKWISPKSFTSPNSAPVRPGTSPTA